MPSSNYLHAVYLNKRVCDAAKAEVYWSTFQSLQANTQQEAKVKARTKDMKRHINQEKLEQNSATMRFVMPSAQLPCAPFDIHVEPGPSVDVLLIS